MCRFCELYLLCYLQSTCVILLQAITANVMSSVSVKFSDLVKQFDGTEDFMEWVDKLELVARMQKIEDLANLIPLFLTGGAFAVYKSIAENDKSDYSKIKLVLQAAFSADSLTAYEELQQRHLQIGESIDVFLADLNRLALLVDETLPSSYINCLWIACRSEEADEGSLQVGKHVPD